MVESKEFIEEIRHVLFGQLHVLKLMRIARDIVGATPLKVQERRDSFIRAHQGWIPRVGMSCMSICRIGLSDGRVDVFFLVGNVALCSCASDVAAQSFNLLLHFCVLRALTDALEVGLDLAIELQAVTPGATLEGILDDIASELCELRRTISLVRSFSKRRTDSPFAGDTRYMLS